MQTLPKGEPGKVAMRGPHVMRGYWNAPALTSEALVDGWLRSIDIRYLDQDGFVFVLDRFKDMVIITDGVSCSVFGDQTKMGESVHASWWATPATRPMLTISTVTVVS